MVKKANKKTTKQKNNKTKKQTNKQYTEITDLTTRIPQKPKVNSRRVSSSYSTSGTRRVNHVTHVSGIMSMVRCERHDPLATQPPPAVFFTQTIGNTYYGLPSLVILYCVYHCHRLLHYYLWEKTHIYDI